jgi:hypothetical protein
VCTSAATCPRQKGRLTLLYAASSAKYVAIPVVPSEKQCEKQTGTVPTRATVSRSGGFPIRAQKERSSLVKKYAKRPDLRRYQRRDGHSLSPCQVSPQGRHAQSEVLATANLLPTFVAASQLLLAPALIGAKPGTHRQTPAHRACPFPAPGWRGGCCCRRLGCRTRRGP